ncbi:hypothetical protein [Hymenobacter psychrotolerans]|nr:hypothetical protein [Hymenobacter psychrotolerans]
MKTQFLSLLFFVSLFGTALTSHAQTAAPDTVGEHKMLKMLAVDMCRQLEQENKKKPLSGLTQADAQQVFVRVFTQAVTSDKQLMDRVGGMGSEARAYGEQMGRRVVLLLLQDCPVSHPLLMRLGESQTPAAAAATTPEEAKLVNTLSAEFCSAMTPRIKELKGLSSEKRLPVVSGQLEISFKAHSKEIQQLYGANAMNDSGKLRALGTKVGAQSAQQCPSIMLLFVE